MARTGQGIHAGGCYHDAAVYGYHDSSVQPVLQTRMDQYLYSAGSAGFPGDCVLHLPDEFMEAARIDGASELWVYARIALPLEKPAVVTVALFSFVWSWTDFMGPLIYLTKSSKWTISLGLSQFTNTYGVDWALLMAASAIAILPMVILFFFLQKYFVEGSMSSGVKG